MGNIDAESPCQHYSRAGNNKSAIEAPRLLKQWCRAMKKLNRVMAGYGAGEG